MYDLVRGFVVMFNLVFFGRFLLNWLGGDDYWDRISCVNVS